MSLIRPGLVCKRCLINIRQIIEQLKYYLLSSILWDLEVRPGSAQRSLRVVLGCKDAEALYSGITPHSDQGLLLALGHISGMCHSLALRLDV